MIKEIPIPLVKANQTLFVLGSLLAVYFQNVWAVLFLFIISISSLLFGPRANLAFRITRPILRHRLFYAATESVELQRFNQIIAVSCFTLASLFLFLLHNWIGWIFVVMVILAASAALAGYCVGCLLYFPYKMKIRTWRNTYPRLNILFDFIAGTGAFKPPLQERYQPLMIMGFAHESIRTYLLEIEQQANAMTSIDDLYRAKQKVDELVMNIEHHAIQEDERMYPPIDAKSNGVTTQFEEEHAEGHQIQESMFETFDQVIANTRTLEDAREAILKWTRYSYDHLRHEEKILMPLLPGMFAYDEGLRIARHILDINHEAYLDYHLRFVFEGLKPGQRYAYVTLLNECSNNEQFMQYETVLKPMVPADSWVDFTMAGKMVSY
jgi:hypothetical protein